MTIIVTTFQFITIIVKFNKVSHFIKHVHRNKIALKEFSFPQLKIHISSNMKINKFMYKGDMVGIKGSFLETRDCK